MHRCKDALAQASSSSIPWYGQTWSAVRHGAEDHLPLLVFAIFLGLVFGLALRRRSGVRVSSILALAIGSLTVVSTERNGWAHEGHEHGDDAKALIAPGDTARRLPGGQVFVPKPMQRVLDVRTVVAKPQTAAKTAVFVGRVIANPNRSGLVQSINGGRVIAPEEGLPRLGQ